MTPAAYRQKLEALIYAALTDEALPPFPKDDAWMDSWRGHPEKPLRLRLAFTDADITLTHSIDPAQCADFVVECVVGPVDLPRRGEVFRKLLQENLLFAPSSSRGFGWDKERQVAVFCVACPIDAPHPDALAPLLVDIALHVAQWRQTLLGLPGEPPAL